MTDTADLLITNGYVATVDTARRELDGGWVAITDGLVSGVGASTDPKPAANETLDASGCLVTPGLKHAPSPVPKSDKGVSANDQLGTLWLVAYLVSAVAVA